MKKISPKKIIFNKYIKEDEDIINDLAIDLFLHFIHESMGHQKFVYNNYRNKSDCESCLEFVYGKYGKHLITNLLSKLKDKGNLIKRIDLFTEQNCELLRKYTILKFEAEIRNINISKKNTIEEEIKELEKLINYEEMFQNNDASNKKDFHILGEKVSRENFENNNNNSESDDDDSQFKNNDKNKKKKLNSFTIIDKDEFKEENESEEDNYNDSDCEDDEESFENLYKRVIEKYGFKNDEMIRQRIYNKLKDESISEKEKFDLIFILHHLDEL